MAHPVAVVFAITMAVWIADVRLAPAPTAPPATSAASCKSGPTTPSEGSDLDIVVCAPRLR